MSMAMGSAWEDDFDTSATQEYRHWEDYRRLKAENAKLRELLQRALTSHDKMCTNRGTCLGCLFFNAKPFAPVCPIVSVTRDARELGVEVDE